MVEHPVNKAEFDSRMENIEDKLEKLREDYTQLRVDFAENKGDVKTLLASMTSMEKRFDSIITQAITAAVSATPKDELTAIKTRLTNYLVIAVLIVLLLGFGGLLFNNILSPQAANLLKPAISGGVTH